MFDHIGLHVKDLTKSAGFYEAALAPLGHVIGSRDETSVSIGPPGRASLFLYGSKGPTGPGVHVALTANDRAAVARFHEQGLRAGGKDNGAPGLRTEYAPNYYAAFLVDPDGNNLEALCFSD